ncbi:vWA domain-containing protein [Bacillus dakarensis]|uniref:vWA domain-containing protein n=1 Tax=Robertmurraya dakarensis TaxID=1926278 RepID=UPI0009FE1BB6|nr:VWA domain-containing protein [Bacillus dakarensis]
MMRMRLHGTLILLFFTAMILAACSENDTNTSKPDETNTDNEAVPTEKEQQENNEPSVEELVAELPKPTETIAELVNADPGPFSGKKYEDLTTEEQQEAVELLRELPKVGENPTDEEIELYWRKSLALFHEDYANPAEALGVLELEAFGSPDIEDERFQFKENLNVEILLDGSGSMANIINGRSMMDIAKESIKEFAASLPEGTNIALRVYGHKGTGSDADKKLSCSSNELIYEMNSYNADALGQALNGIKPAGWTPLAKAIEEAKNDLSSYNGESNTNIIYLVSDGIETCDGDPVAQAKSLANSDIQPIVNVIGFDLNAEGQKQLKEVAEAAKGIYSNARNQEELKRELERAREIAQKWQEWQQKAVTSASDLKYDQLLSDIPRFGIEWNESNSNEKFNIREPLRILRDEGHISKKAFQLLSDKTSERFSHVLELNKVIRKDLREMADKNYETIKEEINRKYSENADVQ